MTNTPSVAAAELWRMEDSTARLCAPNLSGKVLLGTPSAGIGQLVRGDVSLDGYVLGVSAGESDPPQDTFVRTADLVAVYAVVGPPSFNWQVYWRASAKDESAVVVDAILSLQTSLLESFPRVTTQSQLTADEVWLVGPDGKSRQLDAESSGQVPSDNHDCVVLRSSVGNWSYAEMTHPLDRGTWQLARSPDGKTKIERTLGGDFMEKGVIRRLRVRGAFLPREDDLEQAAQLFTELAAETPPLTA